MVGYPGFKALLDFAGGLYERCGTLFDIFGDDCQDFICLTMVESAAGAKSRSFYHKNSRGKTLLRCLAPAFHNRCFQQPVY